SRETSMAPWLRKRDGTISYGFRNPDGSWFEMPAPEDEQPSANKAGGALAVNGVAPARPSSAPADGVTSVQQFLREIGRRGGQARAARYSREEIAQWGRVRRNTKERT